MRNEARARGPEGVVDHAARVWPARCAQCEVRGAELCRIAAASRLPGIRPARLRKVPRDTAIQQQGQRPDLVGVLRCGLLRRERVLSDGRRTLLGLMLPGDLLGLIETGPAEASLEAATDAEICVFDTETVRRLEARDWRFRQHLLSEAAEQQIAALEMVWQRGALTGRERILAFLAWAARAMPSEPAPGGGVLVSILLSRRDWADLASTTPESICRTLRNLAEEGLIERVAPGRVRIPDPDLLARLAGIDTGDDGRPGQGTPPPLRCAPMAGPTD
jgi:CRP/FNR family transcriptional regulator